MDIIQLNEYVGILNKSIIPLSIYHQYSMETSRNSDGPLYEQLVPASACYTHKVAILAALCSRTISAIRGMVADIDYWSASSSSS